MDTAFLLSLNKQNKRNKIKYVNDEFVLEQFVQQRQREKLNNCKPIRKFVSYYFYFIEPSRWSENHALDPGPKHQGTRLRFPFFFISVTSFPATPPLPRMVTSQKVYADCHSLVQTVVALVVRQTELLQSSAMWAARFCLQCVQELSHLCKEPCLRSYRHCSDWIVTLFRLDLTSRINGESLRRKRPNYGVVKQSSGFAADDSALLERRGQHTLN